MTFLSPDINLRAKLSDLPKRISNEARERQAFSGLFGAMESPPLYKDEHVSHTVRVSPELNVRLLLRAKQKYRGNMNAYLISLIIRDVELPDLPDCNKCGFRHMGEFLLEQLRKGR